MKTIAVIFGGQSSEHEISCISAANIIEQIDRDKYEIIMIGITKQGHWLKVEDFKSLCNGSWREGKLGAVLLPDAKEQCILFNEKNAYTKVKVDIIFPILHGLYGEDGTIQGLCELAQIPYIGCGVLASAVGMDKAYTKIIVEKLGIRQADFVLAMKHEIVEDIEKVAERVEKKLSYPVFVKPSNAGSSKGVSKAISRESLYDALAEAIIYDKKILIEEMIQGHEVECAVFGGKDGKMKASGVGEILSGAEFYDFDAKYFSEESKTIIDPILPGNASQKIPELAKQIFRAIDGFGLSRVDFFVTESGEIVFNEINTMPGFTSISMYPMLWEAKGCSKKQLVQDLIDLAMERK